MTSTNRPYISPFQCRAYAWYLCGTWSHRTGGPLRTGIGRGVGYTVVTRSCTVAARGVARLPWDLWKGLERPHHAGLRVDIQRPALRTIEARPASGLAGESRRSFAAIDRTETAGSWQTHQRTRQAICRACSNTPAVTASADTVQTRQPATCGSARIAALCGDRPHDGNHGKGVYTRALFYWYQH
jgi:hypothetical protein